MSNININKGNVGALAGGGHLYEQPTNPPYMVNAGYVPYNNHAPISVPAAAPSMNINVNQNQDQGTGGAAQPVPQAAVTTQPLVIAAPMVFKSNPVQMTCPSCKRDIMTQPVYKPGLKTWVACGVLAVCGLFLCSWIPFVVDSCKDATHYCPQCRTIVGSYKPL